MEDDATLSYAEEKQLHSVQEQIELLLPKQEQNGAPQWNKQCNISQTAGISFQKSRLFRVQGVKT
ncbi:MAG: hypothetical protein ACLU3I_08710 [Acutalibacteraceae bacterium]